MSESDEVVRQIERTERQLRGWVMIATSFALMNIPASYFGQTYLTDHPRTYLWAIGMGAILLLYGGALVIVESVRGLWASVNGRFGVGANE